MPESPRVPLVEFRGHCILSPAAEVSAAIPPPSPAFQTLLAFRSSSVSCSNPSREPHKFEVTVWIQNGSWDGSGERAVREIIIYIGIARLPSPSLPQLHSSISAQQLSCSINPTILPTRPRRVFTQTPTTWVFVKSKPRPSARISLQFFPTTASHGTRNRTWFDSISACFPSSCSPLPTAMMGR